MAKGKIEQEIALKVTGAKEAKAAEEIVERLDGQTATATVTVEDKATADARRIAEVIDGLTDEDKTIVLTARADQAERDIKKLTAQIGRAKDAETITIKVNALGNARAELDQIQTELRQLDGDTATVKVEAKGLDDIVDKLDELPGMLGSLSKAIGSGGLAGAAGAIGTGMVLAADAAADMAIDAQTTASLTGDTVEDASRLQSVWKTSGADVNDLNDVLLQMNGVLQTSPELAGQLGINLQDGATIGQRFMQVIEAIEKSTLSASEKATLMSQAFGEEGVRQVQKLLTIVEGDLQGAVDNVAETQLVNEKNVKTAIEFKKNMAEVKVVVQGIANEMGQTLLPVLNEAADLATAIRGEQESGSFLGTVATEAENAINPIERVRDIWGRWQDEFGEKPTGFDDFGGGDFVDGAEEAEVAIDRTAEALERARGRSERFADAQERATEAQQGLVDATNDYRDALNDQFDAMTNIADVSLRASEAQADFAEAATETAAMMGDNGKLIDNSVEGQNAYIDAVARQRDTAVIAAKAAAELAKQQADANGQFFSGVNQLDLMNESLLAQARLATPAARKAIIDYLIEMNQIPADKATEIQALVDQGKFDEAQAMIDEVSKPREVAVNAVAYTEGAETEIQKLIKARNMTVNVSLDAKGMTGYRGLGEIYDAGGTVGGMGGIAGERGTEILDGKYLTTGPTYVPPGTRVTSRVRTTQILRAGRHRFRTFDQGGGGAPVTNVVNNVKVNLPAGADGADVVRQVRRWQRRNGSLL